MSGQYAVEGNGKVNGDSLNGNLDYVILKDLYFKYGMKIFDMANEGDVLTIIMNYIFKEEDKEKARSSGGDIYLATLYSAKLAVAIKAVLPVLSCIFDSMIEDSKKGKTIDELLEAKISQIHSNRNKRWNPNSIEEKIRINNAK